MTQADTARGPLAFLLRLFCWGMVTVTFAFLLEVYLVHWQGQGSARALLAGGPGGVVAALGYAVAGALALLQALRGRARSLQADSEAISALVAYVARGAFFAILFIGLADALISFLRVERLIEPLFGAGMATDLGQTAFRGPNIHMPLAVLGFVVAFFTRTVGFIWLALLVVVAQLSLVIGRFVFSYEQVFMTDLVRTWYAALFLFASAYTLVEEGHVRVDVFYSTMSERARALVNGVGAAVLGMPLCWVILVYGAATSASPIIGPFLRFEQGQQSFGLMTKYLLAVYLGVFAVTMLFQFAALVLKSAGTWRGEGAPDDASMATPRPAMGS